ncbi:SDR family NAD(P)-dependent oxidoreductase [Sandaracinobacter neustonicus]|uniref:SDR family NAD(P)-dependent oxidoreductase n=1 Tax=Sandaracinobacter neustonicus TaxID=1715348 RepID=A0A501XDN6_9SPHN|nr:SDR family NAD(P)-dependent oxidoreductase [Sandaracinobacter neustonicus]TPE58569.1 SDR family NAD(P)-dependent oxidoreductase [Sandaracinobacter neustonicus]
MTGDKAVKPAVRIAVVSGGSSGIGRAFVAQLLGEGYAVYACGRDTGRLGQLKDALPKVEAIPCDVTDRPSVQAFATMVREAHGRIDLLVSNAGGSREVDLAGLDMCADLTGEIRVNYEGAVNLIAEFLPLLKAGAPSCLIVVGSGYGLVPSARVPLYSASKAALHSLTTTLRRTLAPLEISVTEVCPPVVDTPSVRHRSVPKMPPQDVVAQTLAGARKGKPTIYPGKVKFLPLLNRIAPALAERIVAGS